jgi:hypothetical protein
MAIDSASIATRRPPVVTTPVGPYEKLALASRQQDESFLDRVGLLELPAALTEAQRLGIDELPAVLPLGRRLQRLFVTRLEAVPAQARFLLLLMAFDAADAGQALAYGPRSEAWIGSAMAAIRRVPRRLA